MLDAEGDLKLKQVTILAPPHALLEYEYTLNNAKNGSHIFTIPNLYGANESYLRVVPSDSNPSGIDLRVLYYDWERSFANRWSWHNVHGIYLDKAYDALMQAYKAKALLDDQGNTSALPRAEAAIEVEEARMNLDALARSVNPRTDGILQNVQNVESLCNWYHRLHSVNVNDISVVYKMDAHDSKSPIKFIVEFLVNGVTLKIGSTLTLNTRSGSCVLDQYYLISQRSNLHWVDAMFKITLGPKPDALKSLKQPTGDVLHLNSCSIQQNTAFSFAKLPNYAAPQLDKNLLKKLPSSSGPHTLFSDGRFAVFSCPQSDVRNFLVTFVVVDTDVAVSRIVFLKPDQINLGSKGSVRLVIDGDVQDITDSLTQPRNQNGSDFVPIKIADAKGITIEGYREESIVDYHMQGARIKKRQLNAVNLNSEPINVIVAQRLPNGANLTDKEDNILERSGPDDAILMFEEVNRTSSTSSEPSPIWNQTTRSLISQKVLQPRERWLCSATYSL